LPVRFYYAVHDSRTPLFTGAFRAAINLGLNIVLPRYVGIAGIALANALAITADVIILRIMLLRKWSLNDGIHFWPKIVIALMPMTLITYIVYRISNTLEINPGWVIAACQIAVSGSIGVLVYWGIALFLKIPESRYILVAMGKCAKVVRMRYQGGI
jgi:putative peptidoglycan lipid II flippase